MRDLKNHPRIDINKVISESISTFTISEIKQLNTDEKQKRVLIDLVNLGNEFGYCGSKDGGLNYLEFLRFVEIPKNIIFPRLEKIKICNSDLRDIDWDFLPKHENLRNIYILNCNLPEMPTFSDLVELEELSVEYSKVSKISGLDGLVNLRQLSLNGNEIEYINGLISLKKLEKLYIERNLIRDLNGLKGLEKLTNLKDIALDNNKIVDLDIDCEIPNLAEITLSNNEIFHITAVKNLPSLKVLNLRNNKVERVENFSNLPSLEVVIVSENPIRSFAGLENLPTSAYIKEMNRKAFTDLDVEELEKYLDSIGWKYKWEDYWDECNNKLETGLVIGGPES